MGWFARIVVAALALVGSAAALVPTPVNATTLTPARPLASARSLTPARSLASVPRLNPCDDGMGGTDTGSSLIKIFNLKPGPKPPTAQKWVHAHMKAVLKNQAMIDKILTWPKGSTPKKNCTLTTFKYTKLCVPRNKTSRGLFRAKTLLKTTKCGNMTVKWRVAVVKGKTPRVLLWGRSKS